MSEAVGGREQIVVVTHVGRDLLQSAAVFKHERLVVWEYVSNGLQYIDTGVSPIVRVTIDSKAKKITVSDNGRGMSWSDLRNFFVMHGENVDRKQGRPGRGYFGTGKAAAFGIASCLRVTTDKNGKRSSVQLRRPDIEAMSSTDPHPRYDDRSRGSDRSPQRDGCRDRGYSSPQNQSFRNNPIHRTAHSPMAERGSVRQQSPLRVL